MPTCSDPTGVSAGWVGFPKGVVGDDTIKEWFGWQGSGDSVTRRGFLGAAAAGAAASGFVEDMTVLDVLKNPAIAAEIKKQQKHVILLWLAGGASQLETWDPKPGRPTGGPFLPISTNVPGVEISELLPKMAGRMQDTAIIRSLSTGIGTMAAEPR
ncbi:MAG: hypothetical protein Ct9H300mP1_29100 [Planctomycetaceae bacterium]|nr:MAG: hypothetical protein Ct9H300mP1_29100 [Planctomycetaceae bacterium]